MENNLITDSQITASDQWDNLNWAAPRARLNHNTAWSTHIQDGKQWIKIELNQQQYVTGLITQGKNHAWVKTYTKSNSQKMGVHGTLFLTLLEVQQR